MRAPFDPYGAASPAIDQQLGDAFQVVRFVARHIPEIASVAYHMEALYTLASAGGKANADLLGLPYDAVDLGEFQGNILPDNITVKSALQTLSDYISAWRVELETGYTVLELPSVLPPYRRAIVTDALNPLFGDPVVGGGSKTTPVYSDGVDWIVG